MKTLKILNIQKLKKITIKNIIDEVIQEFYPTIQKINENINEGLIKTYGFDFTKRYVLKTFYMEINDVFEYQKILNGISVRCPIIQLNQNISKERIGEIKNSMNSCGYVFSDGIKKNNVQYLNFEPKFSTDISEDIKCNYQYLYHATPSIYVDKIMKIGLTPKTKNSLGNYPDRIYMTIGNDLSQEDLMLFGALQNLRANNNIYDNNEYSIIQIDVKKLPNNIKMYIDPRANNAVFTYDNIKPECLSIYGILSKKSE